MRMYGKQNEILVTLEEFQRSLKLQTFKYLWNLTLRMDFTGDSVELMEFIINLIRIPN